MRRTRDLSDLINMMINPDPSRRPDIDEVLLYPLLQKHLGFKSTEVQGIAQTPANKPPKPFQSLGASRDVLQSKDPALQQYGNYPTDTKNTHLNVSEYSVMGRPRLGSYNQASTDCNSSKLLHTPTCTKESDSNTRANTTSKTAKLIISPQNLAREQQR